MKSLKWLVAVIIIALLAGYYILATGLLRENRQNGDLRAQISSLTAQLAAMPETASDLEERLSAAGVDLAAAENAFSGETNDTRIVDSILRLARDTGVTAIPLATHPRALEQIEGYSYSVFSMTFSVTGDFQHLQSFIGGLETSEITTLTVTKLQLQRTSAETGAGITADIDVAVYTFVPGAE
jgi:hypothetical protein